MFFISNLRAYKITDLESNNVGKNTSNNIH
jgi:hypothetical protein